MLPKHGIELFDFGLQGSVWEPEEDDAGVGEALVVDQLTEIAIRNHQNALLVAGNGNDILVSKAIRIILGNGRNIVALHIGVIDAPVCN